MSKLMTPEMIAELQNAEARIKAGFYYTSVADSSNPNDDDWLAQCHKCKAIGCLTEPFPHVEGCLMVGLKPQIGEA